MPCGVIGDILAADWSETALRGLCQPSIHNKYVTCCSFHSLTHPHYLHCSLPIFVRSLVRSAWPLFFLPVIHREFLFPRHLIPADDTIIEPLLTLLNSTTPNRLILGPSTLALTTSLQ